MDFHLNTTTDSVHEARPLPPLCVEPETPVGAVLQLLKQRRTGSVLVCRDEKLIGIFTERDALRLMADGSDLEVPIERVMVARPSTLTADSCVADAIESMARGGYRRLPIVDKDGRPTSVVKSSSILHYLVEHFPKMIYNLPPQPHHTTQEREGA